MRSPESYSGVWSILVPPIQAYLWTTFFAGRIFPVNTRGRRDLSSFRVYRPKSLRLEGVRIWKLSRTYSGEKSPSLSVLTHRCSLVTRKSTWHLLIIPRILVRIGALTRVDDPLHSTCPGTMKPSLTQDF